MGMTEMLRVVVTADTDQAVKKIKQLGGASDDTAKSTDELGKKSAATGRLMKAGLVVGATAAAYAMVRFGASSVKAAAEAEAAQMRLDDAFAKFPKLADSSADALRGLNTELQKKTRFDDDALASGQAILAQFDLTGRQLEEVTPLVADYAAKMGLDIPEAATNVGKALLGNTRALKSLGIDYKLTGDATADYANITELMAQKVGGFAEKEGKTAAGQLAILNNQFGELQETVGKNLLPAMSGVVTTMTGVVSAFGSLPGPVQTGTLAVGALGVAALVLVPRLAAAKAGLVELGITSTATGGKLATLAKGVGGLAAAFAAFEVIDVFSSAAETSDLGDKFKEYASVEELKAEIKKLEAAAGQAKDIEDGMFSAFKNTFNTEAPGIAWDSLWSSITGDENLEDRLTRLRGELKNWKGDAAGASDATGDLAAATGDLNGELDDSIERFSLLNGGVIDLTKANMDFIAGQEDITAAFRESGGALGDMTKEQRDAKTALISQAEGIEQVRAAMELQKVPAAEIATRTAALRQAMIDQAVAAGGNRAAVEALVNSILKIPTTAATVVSVETAQAEAKIAALRARWEAFKAAFSGMPAPNLPSGANVQKRAAGGPVTAGTPYLVGERGPEIFTPMSGGRITPNGGVGGSAAGSPTVNVYVSGSVTSERDLARTVRDAMVDMARRGDTVAA